MQAGPLETALRFSPRRAKLDDAVDPAIAGRGLFAGFVVLLLTAPLAADERMNVRILYCGDPGSERNLEYLRATQDRPPLFAVDEDAKAVGPSNRSVEMLARCVRMLEQKRQPELAFRLLKRYTQEKFDTAGQWRAWLDANRGRLFFSDVGGYKFFVAPTEKPGRTTTLSTRK